MNDTTATKPIRRIKRKNGSFAITSITKSGNASRISEHGSASECIKAYKELLATGLYHEAE
ncbi:hypothetical protein [uncultured Fibrella sp.]|uniref:hypothetical protein n=1 Tax=uncultured Fibrella sp. TaxID=1284596 RepID=UPI0035CC1FC7